MRVLIAASPTSLRPLVRELGRGCVTLPPALSIRLETAALRRLSKISRERPTSGTEAVNSPIRPCVHLNPRRGLGHKVEQQTRQGRIVFPKTVHTRYLGYSQARNVHAKKAGQTRIHDRLPAKYPHSSNHRQKVPPQ